MSLFNICNWWSAQCTDLEGNYDVASLLCTRFGLDEHEKDYIVVGSHTGNLSIFYPNFELDGKASFKATDLLLETRLNEPILGVFSGVFTGNPKIENSNQLAILHPYCVAIFNVQTVTGVAEHGTQLKLKPLSEYKFRRLAFSFCKGHFGKVKGREFFCVVHLNGSLTFFEQDGITYECNFPGHRALPAPVAYCERTDSFFRLSATWNLECFTFQDLSHSSINKSHFTPIWSICIGEGIVDMSVVQLKEEYASIMILGERNFICFSDNGKMEFILKLDYVPKCFHSFIIGYYWEQNSRMITAIASEASKLFIYERSNIIWAAKCPFDAPVALKRSNINGLPGGIVALGSDGHLSISYLGSDAFTFKVPAVNVTELSLAQAHKELVHIEDEIKEAVDIQNMDSINQKAYEDVRLNFSIDNFVNHDLDTLLFDVPANVAVKELPSCTGFLKFKTKIALNEMQITFNMAEGIRCSQEPITYCQLPAGTMEEIKMDFYIADLLHIHSSRVDVIVSFITESNIPRAIQQSAYLPLTMFYKPKQPQKSASLKLTFNITSNKVKSKLSTFLPEFVESESELQAIGLQLLCPGDSVISDEMITIVTAKSSNRLRLQTEHLETLPLILERLIKVAENNESQIPSRKNKKIGALNKRIDSIVTTPTLPIQQVMHRIDIHRETQENIKKQTEELDELWFQFKTLQTKLQERAEDESKDTLVLQIEENYDKLISEGDKLMEMRKDERKQRADLSCALSVATLLISCMKLEERILNLTLAVLVVPIDDWTELSWEESMAPGVEMLHHYGPLSRSKNNSSNTMPDINNSIEQFDYIRFRRHMVTLFERILYLVNVPASQTEKVSKLETKPNEIGGLDKILKTKDNLAEKQLRKVSTLEAVEDNEDEYDEDDLRNLGYKKDFGPTVGKKDKSESEWVNENFELPSSEELFNDLGIWW